MVVMANLEVGRRLVDINKHHLADTNKHHLADTNKRVLADTSKRHLADITNLAATIKEHLVVHLESTQPSIIGLR